MKKAVIYPFTENMIPIVRYWNRTREQIQIVSAVMLHRKGLEGRDVGFLKNQPDTGIKICSDLMAALSDCDTLLVADEKLPENMSETIMDNMQEAMLKKKNVICMQTITGSQSDCLKQLAGNMGVDFEYYDNSRMENLELCYVPQKLYRPDVPIIMVGEMFDNLDGMDVTLSISRILRSQGYKSIVIAEQGAAACQELITFPNFLRSSDCGESDKIYYLNNYIQQIEAVEKPDVIIIRIPDAMLKYNDMFCNGFGMIPFMISQAVAADYFVFCTQYDKVEPRFYDMLSESFRYRYGFEIDCVHMSNTMLDAQDTKQINKLSFLHQTQENLNKLLETDYKENPIPILNCLREEDCERLCRNIIDKLSGYNSVSSMI